MFSKFFKKDKAEANFQKAIQKSMITSKEVARISKKLDKQASTYLKANEKILRQLWAFK